MNIFAKGTITSRSMAFQHLHGIQPMLVPMTKSGFSCFTEKYQLRQSLFRINGNIRCNDFAIGHLLSQIAHGVAQTRRAVTMKVNDGFLHIVLFFGGARLRDFLAMANDDDYDRFGQAISF